MRALPDVSWVGINQKAQHMRLRRSEPYVLEPPLTYSDMLFMEETGASMDEVCWKVTGYLVDEQDRIPILMEEVEGTILTLSG